MTDKTQPLSRGVLVKWRQFLSPNRPSQATDAANSASELPPTPDHADDQTSGPQNQAQTGASDTIGTPKTTPQSLIPTERVNMNTDLGALTQIGGFIGCCLVDSETGLMLSSEGGGRLDLEAASALNTQVVQAKLQAITALKLDDSIEDLLITLGKQYHLIRPLAANPSIFIYLALDRKAANLGLARLKLKDVEATLKL